MYQAMSKTELPSVLINTRNVICQAKQSYSTSEVLHLL